MPRDTGDPLADPAATVEGVRWERDVGRSMEYPPASAPGKWIVAPNGGPLRCLSAEDGDELWGLKLTAPSLGSPVVCGDVVVQGIDFPVRELWGVSLATGEVIWKTDFEVVLYDGEEDALVATGRGGWISVLDPGDGEVRWETTVPGAGWRPPVLRPELNLVVVPIRPDSLVGFDLETGKRRWSRRVGAWPSVAPGDGPLVVATDDSLLVLLDPEDGSERARLELGGMVAQHPVVTPEGVYLALRDGALMALDPEDLGVRWVRFVGSPLVCAPLVTEIGPLVQSGARGIVHVHDAGTGEPLATVQLPERLKSSPRFRDGLLVVGGAKGLVAAYGVRP